MIEIAKMKIRIAGLGLIGGSFLKAAEKALYDVAGYHHDERPDLSDADVIIVSLPPSAIEPWIRANSPTFKKGAIVVDVCGVKSPLFEAFKKDGVAQDWVFVPGHPMAGKEVGGFENATSDLFEDASMILTPYPYTGRAPLDKLEEFFKSIGFSKVVFTSPGHHDEIIAFTSQLCHLISSAYVREGLAKDSSGFTAGSFRDMVRVGAPDPVVWTELFLLNRESLLPVLERYIERLENFRRAIGERNAESLRAQLEEGKKAKSQIGS